MVSSKSHTDLALIHLHILHVPAAPELAHRFIGQTGDHRTCQPNGDTLSTSI
jgi:hypothetical protein